MTEEREGVGDRAANPPSLEIKSVVGGGLEDKRWTAAIDALQASLRDFGEPSSDPFGLTVTYFIPGEVYGPKFSGVRVGAFLEEFRSLVVQVALPEHPHSDASEELLDHLSAAVSKAEAWGKRKKRLSGQLTAARDAAAYLRAQQQA